MSLLTREEQRSAGMLAVVASNEGSIGPQPARTMASAKLRSTRTDHSITACWVQLAGLGTGVDGAEAAAKDGSGGRAARPGSAAVLSRTAGEEQATVKAKTVGVTNASARMFVEFVIVTFANSIHRAALVIVD